MTAPLSANSAVRSVLGATGLRLVTGHVVVPMSLVEAGIQQALATVDVIKSFGLEARAGFADLKIVLMLLGNPLNLDAQLGIARARINDKEAQLLLSLMAPPAVGVSGTPISSQFVRVLDVLGHAALETVKPDDFSDLINHDQNGRLLKIDFNQIPAVRQALERKIGGIRVRDLFTVSRGVVTEAGIVLRFGIHWGALIQALFGMLLEALALKKR